MADYETFLEEFGKLCDFGLEKELNVVSRAQQAILELDRKTTEFKAMWTLEAKIKSFRKDIISNCDREHFQNNFAKTTSAFLLVLRCCPRLNCFGLFCWQGRFQNNLVITIMKV